MKFVAAQCKHTNATEAGIVDTGRWIEGRHYEA
jgi:hypothetical protein